MATESPVRMVESGATNWPTSQIHNNMAADEIEGLLNNTHRYQILNQRNMAPNRSGSAPPSIEGSFAAIYSNLIAQKSFNSKLILENPVSEEQMRADPAYFAYYYSNVNLNPRLPPPLVASRDNKGNIGNNMRLTSYEEEAEDEKSDSCSDSGNLLKSEYDICNRSLVDLIQEDFPRTPSPLFSRSSSYHATTTTSDDLQPNISLENLFLSASNSSSNSNFSYANTNDKETKNEGAKPYSSKRIPSFLPNIPDTNSQYSQQKYPNKNNPPHQEQQQQCTIFSQPGVSAYYINPHGAQNHQQIPENVSPLQSPLPATAYNMNFSGNHYLPFYYPGTSHLFSSEYGGYNFNSAFIPPPFVAGYPHATSRIHMQYAAAATSSISGGEYLLHQQNINNFYSDGGGYYQSPPPAPPPIIQFQVSPLGSPLLPSSPVAGLGKRNDFNRNKGGIYGLDSLNNDLRRKYSILDELKSVGARNIQLSDIAGRIAEFSVDQHGSRFIQQKLENCGVEERESVFREVIPHASKLMTDVFGNYVIQKFFEHGSREQRKQLADQISGKVLPLTLQMYGCRVIQKALEVIELDQKSELIHELDGNVLRCVRDQNGNHVIQKCIESIPTKNIGFIISSFQGQVATLSTHPYGCRVIQRVLEHCGDELQIQCIIDEILESAQTLAHDQHGNYVIQHVLERGKPHERSQIISKLSGKIVEMSQHKYASNVVEKCLEHGDVTERKALIQEIIGQSEDNNNLLPMIKDQFANYVVQKILEISNDKQREVLLDRININLQALKKYTYGKHIVARFEQLCGEEAEESSS